MNDEVYDRYDEAGLSSISDRDAEVAMGIGVLEALLDAMSDSPDLERAADRLLEATVTLLGLSRASLELVEERSGVQVLNPLAAAGEHAALTRDMPARPLRSSADAAQAVSSRSPVIVGDLHGVGDLAENENGVARWRAGMSAQAYAVLPLLRGERDRALGVLTLEWSTPHEFEATERDALTWMARSLAAAIGEFGVAGVDANVTPTTAPALRAASPTPLPVQAAPTVPTHSIELGFDRAGGISSPDDYSAESPPSLRIAFALAEPDSDRSAVLWDVIELPEGEVLVFAGIADAPARGAAVAAERSRQLVRASVLSGMGAGRSLAMLAHWVHATARAGARVSAAACRVNPITGEVHASLGGATTFGLLGRDGRISRHEGGVGADVVERSALSLVGDQLVLMSGGRGAMPEPGPSPATLLEARGPGGGLDAARLLATLMSLGGDRAGHAAVAVVVDVVRLGAAH